MAMESKDDIYKMIPEEHIPKTLHFQNNTDSNAILKACAATNITFPFIIKPDIGMKGLGVAKIHDGEELAAYLKKNKTDYIVQEYISHPNEVGIFYVRHPNEKKGSVTGIVSKEFLTITGNGKSTVGELIIENPRSHLQLNRLRKKYGSYLKTIPGNKEKITLMSFGSHTLGARFLDLSNAITPELTERVNAICQGVPQFYYGRLDVKLTSLEDFTQGINYSIIEINGAGSEPTHIYDSSHTIFYAWKEICRHWFLLQKISQANFCKGVKYLSFKEGLSMLKQNGQLEKQLRQI